MLNTTGDLLSMKKSLLDYLVCPKTGSKLTLKDETLNNEGEVETGILVNKDNYEYKITESLADLVHEDELVGDAKFARNYYTQISDTYDENLQITFDLYNDTAENTRNFMVNKLDIKPEDNILEISAGTGKDSEIILSKLNEKGSLTLLDITPAMLQCARKNIKESKASTNFVSGTACSLPFADNTFNKLYCFAGVGHFPDVKKAFKEMARVVKPGGKVVLCEKNVPPWLKSTEYAKILINNNPMFAYDIPLDKLPIEARNVGIHWILGNVHYVIDYTVGIGEPEGNFDLELPGARGGSFNTRYYGKLEGVTKETKDLAIKAREKAGVSMHKWLDDIVKKEALKILEEE